MHTIGVDIGGVILEGPNLLPGAVATLHGLVDAGHTIHLISFCGKRREAETRVLLAQHDFFTLTGIPEARLHFVRSRAAKAPLCQQLGVGVMIDDTPAVLAYMVGVVPIRLCFGQAPWMSWQELASHFDVGLHSALLSETHEP